MQKKYIVVEQLFSENIIIFSAVLDHKTVAGDMKVISAGFVNIAVNGFGKVFTNCWGKSKTLEISSRPKEDSILANILLKEDW